VIYIYIYILFGQYSLDTWSWDYEKHHVKVSNRFVALEGLDSGIDNSAWEIITEHIKTSAKESLGYYGLKRHKPWFDEG
jgi:hypothetical protein